MLSLNEVGSTVLKAARGAGIPLGQAEDLAKVATYLVGIGGDMGVITQALQEPLVDVQAKWEADRVQVTAGSAVLVGPVICDAFAMGYDCATFADPAHRRYIGTALAAADVSLTWDDLTIRRSDTGVLKPKGGPVTVPQSDWDIWLGLAAKTYVPESETSRLAGAGAGLTDND